MKRPGRREPSAEDERLRSLFAELHAGDNPPTFERLARRRHGRRRPVRRWAAAAAALALAAALAWTWARTTGPTGTTERSAADELALASSLSRWRAPLDFLLETPGSELLTVTPNFGGSSPALPDIEHIDRKETL